MGNGTEGTEEQPRVAGHHPTDAELERRFTYHPPRDDGARTNHTIVSEITLEMAKRLRMICWPGRNLDLALQHLEDVRMRANAAIAVDDPRP